MRYIFFGYLAARIRFNKRDTVAQASQGEAVKRVYDNAKDSINQLMKDTVFNSSPMMSDWVNIAYNTISAYETLREIKTLTSLERSNPSGAFNLRVF